MAGYVRAEVLEVHAFGRFVGAVALDPASGFYVFEYDPAWTRSGIELAPLTMPAVAGVPYVFPDLSPRTYHRLPAMLADALPDRFGNALVDAWMARQGIARDEITALDRLAYASDRAMGALEFRPPARPPDADPPSAVQMADLVAAARAAVAGRLDPDDDAVSTQALNDLIQVGTSAGGARAKAVLAFNPETGQIRSGQLPAPPGFEHWLCKLDGVGDDGLLGQGAGFGRIEYAYHLMARAAGIDMSECRLLLEYDRAHLMTRRFDRTSDGGKLHVQTLCAMAHLDFNLIDTHDYAQYLATVDELGLGPDAREQAFRRIVFNVAAVNRDDHTKNLAFLMEPDGRWSLAPAYDVVFAHNPEGRWTQRHQMGVGGRFEGITRDDLLDLADRFVVPAPREVLGDVLAAVAIWPEAAAEAGVPDETIAHIAAAHRRFAP